MAGDSLHLRGKILDAGYDGVYLDIVDAYQYWESGGQGNPDHPTAEEDMVKFVTGIVEYARLTKGRSDFQVFVQTAEELSVHPDHVETVSGIGRGSLLQRQQALTLRRPPSP